MRTIHKLLLTGAMLLVGVFAAQAQPGGFPGGQMPDAEQIAKMRADQMKESVKLTDKQYQDVVKVFKAEMEEMQKMFEGGGAMGGDFEQMRKDMEKRQEEQNKQLKAILTEDQFKTWQKQQEEMRAQFGGGGFGGF